MLKPPACNTIVRSNVWGLKSGIYQHKMAEEVKLSSMRGPTQRGEVKVITVKSSDCKLLFMFMFVWGLNSNGMSRSQAWIISLQVTSTWDKRGVYSIENWGKFQKWRRIGNENLITSRVPVPVSGPRYEVMWCIESVLHRWLVAPLSAWRSELVFHHQPDTSSVSHGDFRSTTQSSETADTAVSICAPVCGWTYSSPGWLVQCSVSGRSVLCSLLQCRPRPHWPADTVECLSRKCQQQLLTAAHTSRLCLTWPMCLLTSSVLASLIGLSNPAKPILNPSNPSSDPLTVRTGARA